MGLIYARLLFLSVFAALSHHALSQTAISDEFITPRNRKVLMISNEEDHVIQWRQGKVLKTLEHAFYTSEKGHSRYPRFISENANYIFFRVGCGNPCWSGIFLPLYPGGKAQMLPEYVAADLDAGLVAFVHDTDFVVFNLRTSAREEFYPGKCASIFNGYCVDTAYFRAGKFVYYWNADTFLGGKKERKAKASWRSYTLRTNPDR